MIYIVLSILASTGVLILFRLLDGTGANTRHVITFSYLVSAVVGMVVFWLPINQLVTIWFWPSVFEGVLFYFVFRVIAKTAQINGVSVAAIATKMSVVIPISVGFVVLGEQATLFKVLGIIAGLAAVMLTIGQDSTMREWRWPLLAFLGTGTIDASFKLFQVWGMTESLFPAFVSTTFGFAFIAGISHHFTLPDRRISAVSLGNSVGLGCLNLATVVFLLKALAIPQWESSVVFSLNHFGGVMVATLAAVVVFRERIRVRGLVGLALAALSIALLYLNL